CRHHYDARSVLNVSRGIAPHRPYGGKPVIGEPLVRPPSATMDAPVIAEDSSLARNSATLAISSGLMSRPSACAAAISARDFGVICTSMSNSGVSTHPGQMQLARMLWRPYSTAALRGRVVRPAFAGVL